MNLEILTKQDLIESEKRIAAMLAQFKVETPKKKYMTMKEAAEYINCKTTCMRSRVNAGEIPYIRDGHKIQFSVDDLDAYMMAHRVMSDEEAAGKCAHF